MWEIKIFGEKDRKYKEDYIFRNYLNQIVNRHFRYDYIYEVRVWELKRETVVNILLKYHDGSYNRVRFKTKGYLDPKPIVDKVLKIKECKVTWNVVN